MDGRENHGSGRGKLLHKGAYSPITARLAQSEFKVLVSQFPLAWQSQGREGMVIAVHPSKFWKNLLFATITEKAD